MKIEWLQQARNSLHHHLDYIEQQNPAAALDINEATIRALVSLVDYPQMGRPGRVKGTRELVISGTPYILVYRQQDASIAIIGFLHGAQKWPDRF